MERGERWYRVGVSVWRRRGGWRGEGVNGNKERVKREREGRGRINGDEMRVDRVKVNIKRVNS